MSFCLSSIVSLFVIIHLLFISDHLTVVHILEAVLVLLEPFCAFPGVAELEVGIGNSGWGAQLVIGLIRATPVLIRLVCIVYSVHCTEWLT